MFFFFNDTATTEIYTLSLHDALPISGRPHDPAVVGLYLPYGGEYVPVGPEPVGRGRGLVKLHVGIFGGDRKSTRLNSSHANISYAVFCLKKKNHFYPYNTPHIIATPT